MAEEQQHEMSEYEQTRARIEAEREEKEELARRLSVEASRQWQKVIEGVLALPAAVALRTSANALYAASFLGRGFEVFQRGAESMRSEIRARRPNGGWRQPNQGASPPQQPF